MFSQFFGDYLVKKGSMSESDFSHCMDYMKANRVKLGLIAESEGLLTREQTNELNQLQAQTDKRFGDLAVEKGYLTPSDVTKLLGMQGSPYLMFIQALLENQILDNDRIQEELEDFQRDLNITNSALEAIKIGDFERLLPNFLPDDKFVDRFALALRNLVRFVTPYLRIEPAITTKTYKAKYLSYQRVVSEEDGLFGFASDTQSFVPIASSFAKEDFATTDEDVLDALCEFANCINGLYASELSHKNVAMDMLPPEFYEDGELKEPNDIYILPVYVAGERVVLLAE